MSRLFSGDLPKQLKVKKLSKLKTMDTKPGHMTDLLLELHVEKKPFYCDKHGLPVCRDLHSVPDVSPQRQDSDQTAAEGE